MFFANRSEAQRAWDRKHCKYQPKLFRPQRQANVRPMEQWQQITRRTMRAMQFVDEAIFSFASGTVHASQKSGRNSSIVLKQTQSGHFSGRQSIVFRITGGFSATSVAKPGKCVFPCAANVAMVVQANSTIWTKIKRVVFQVHSSLTTWANAFGQTTQGNVIT